MQTAASESRSEALMEKKMFILPAEFQVKDVLSRIVYAIDCPGER